MIHIPKLRIASMHAIVYSRQIWWGFLFLLPRKPKRSTRRWIIYPRGYCYVVYHFSSFQLSSARHSSGENVCLEGRLALRSNTMTTSRYILRNECHCLPEKCSRNMPLPGRLWRSVSGVSRNGNVLRSTAQRAGPRDTDSAKQLYWRF